MDYLLILVGSYVVGAILVLWNYSKGNKSSDVVFARMGEPGPEAKAEFRKVMLRKAWLILVWQTFLAGSAVGTVASLVYREGMNTIGWIAVIVLAIPVAWFLLKLVTSFAVPTSVSGALLLKKELQENGISTDNLPPAFYKECVTWAKGVSKVCANTPIARRAEFVRTLESLARTAALWVREPDGPMFKSYGSGKSFYRELFERFGVKAR
jgi:hypothetical protein